MELINKRCPKCEQAKPISEFYKNNSKKDGYACYCKTCDRTQVDLYQSNYPEKVKSSKRKYHQSEKGKTAKKRDNLNYRLRYPKQHKAQAAVSKAIYRGKFSKATQHNCTYCSSVATEYHHPSYKWEHRFDVIPICFQCHRKLHKISHINKLGNCQQNSA